MMEYRYKSINNKHKYRGANCWPLSVINTDFLRILRNYGKGENQYEKRYILKMLYEKITTFSL